MTWGAVAVAGAAVVGSVIASNGAQSAADTQAGATQSANALQKYMYDTQRSDNAPFLQTGTAANQKLAYLLGIGGNQAGGLTRDQLRSQLLPQFTTQNNVGSSSSNHGDWIPVRFAVGDQTAIWRNTVTGEQVEGNPPQQQATNSSSSVDEQGLQAAINARLQSQQPQGNPSNDPAFGSLLKPFDQNALNNDLVYQNGLQFGLNEGEKGVNQQAAASGSYLSGATLKALSQYGNDYATTKTGDAYNRYKNDQSTTFNMLSGISGTGQVANGQTAAAGQNYANQASNNLTSLGSARGASAIAQGNALAGGLTGAANGYQNANLYNALTNKLNGANGTSSNDNWVGYDMPTANSFSNGDYYSS